MSTYQHIAQRAAHVPVRPLCQALRVAPAAYYAWHRQQGCPNPESDWQVAVRAAPNHLLGQAAPTAPDWMWVGRTRQGDITSLPHQGGGWRSLAVWLDRCSHKVVGRDVC